MSDNLRLIAINEFDSATVAVSPAAASGLPITNLQDSKRARVWRSTSTADQVITGNFSGAVPVDGLVLWRHNLSGAGTWQVELFSSDNQVNEIYDSGELAVYDILPLGELDFGADPLGLSVFSEWGWAYSVLWLPELKMPRSYRITLSDADNADGYLQASRLVIGRGMQPEYNASWGGSLAWVDESKHQRMAGGSLHVEQVEVYRELEISLDWLTDVDRRRLTEAQRRSGKRGEVFISLYPGAGGAKERDHSLVGRMATTNPFSVDNQLFHSHSLRVVEG